MSPAWACVVGLSVGMLHQGGVARAARADSVSPFCHPCKNLPLQTRGQLDSSPPQVSVVFSASTINCTVAVPCLLSSGAQGNSWHILPQSWRTAQSHVPQPLCSKNPFSARLESFKTRFMLFWPLCMEVSDRCVNISQGMKLLNGYKNKKNRAKF